jgi:hypothetical protein
MWGAYHEQCPECKKVIIWLRAGDPVSSPPKGVVGLEEPYAVDRLVEPRGASRPPCPAQVTDDNLREDYTEACLVLPDSPKASAALSRRCLQHLLRTAASVKTKSGNLADEIQEVLDSGLLPSHLATDLDAVRWTGNFAAHPMKATHSGEILPVEPGEAEWNLDVLEGLFDFFFVGPATSKARRDALNAKLKAAGKPPLKEPGP